MRMPRVQFTIRRIMIVIAAIAVVLGVGLEGWRLKRFRDQCLMKAQFLADSPAEFPDHGEIDRDVGGELESHFRNALGARRNSYR